MFVNEARLQRNESAGVLQNFATSDVLSTNSSISLESSGIETKPLSLEHSLRKALLLIFNEPASRQCSLLQNLSARQWRRLLRWLDYSGLALYFFDRIRELRKENILSSHAASRLKQSLAENTARTHGMIAESIAIQQSFQDSNVRYANLKGFSLYPESVPRPELRSQFDLDFLVASESASIARTLLERRGYRVYSITNRSLEFKINERPCIALRDMYKHLQSWRVELHIEPDGPDNISALKNLTWREVSGFRMPALAPVELFLGQGLHAYKHICSEFFRASLLLEFRRHVLSRGNDQEFWTELADRVAGNRRAAIGLGVVTLLATQVMGEFAPKALTEWTVAALPNAAHLWVTQYGQRVVLEDFPGSKLYLLLEKELEREGIPSKRLLRDSLLPSRLPPPIIRPREGESFSERLARQRMQLKFILHRLRFHLIEGTRYIWELLAWRLIKKRLAH
jgi:hypothetical protein